MLLSQNAEPEPTSPSSGRSPAGHPRTESGVLAAGTPLLDGRDLERQPTEPPSSASRRDAEAGKGTPLAGVIPMVQQSASTTTSGRFPARNEVGNSLFPAGWMWALCSPLGPPFPATRSPRTPATLSAKPPVRLPPPSSGRSPASTPRTGSGVLAADVAEDASSAEGDDARGAGTGRCEVEPTTRLVLPGSLSLIADYCTPSPLVQSRGACFLFPSISLLFEAFS